MCRIWQYKEEIYNGVNYIISILFIGMEIQFLEEMSLIHILSLALILIAILYRIFFVHQNISWKLDLSPIFLWILTIIRIINAFQSQKNANIIVFYSMGFINGQYNSTLITKPLNSSITKGKIIVQTVVLIVCLVIQLKEDTIKVVIEIILIVLISGYEIHFQQEQEKLYVSSNSKNQSHQRHQQSFINMLKSNSKNSNEEQVGVKHSRNQAIDQLVEEDQIVDSSRLEQQNLIQKTIWHNFVDQSDDYIARFVFSLNQFDQELANSINNNSCNKFLEENKINFLEFIKELKVHNDLNVTKFDATNSEFNKVQTLYEWLHSNLEQYKLIEQIQIRKSLKSLQGLFVADELSLPSGQRSLMLDLVMEKSIMGLSVIPHQYYGGSSEALGAVQFKHNNKITLYGTFKSNKGIIIDLNIRVYVYEEEFQSQNQLIVVFTMKDIEKLVQCIKQNIKHLSMIETSTKFIQKQAHKITEIHRFIKDAEQKQQNLIETEHTTRVGTAQQLLKRTYSIGSNKDSMFEGHHLEISEKNFMRKSVNAQFFICKLQFQLFQIEQDYFNFFQVFSTNEQVWLEQKKIDVTQTIHYLFEQFQNDKNVIKYSIKLTLNEDQLFDKEMVTDPRRFKQLLINFINNSIQSYNQEEYIQQQNKIEIIVQNSNEEINFEIIDNGCGLLESDLTLNRLQECKLGLAACQRLLFQIGSGKKEILVNYSDNYHTTKVIFKLPKVLLNDKYQAPANEFCYENISIISS